MEKGFMKRSGYIFEKICAFENLYAAFKKAFSASGRSYEACRFHFNLERELLNLRDEIESGKYQPGNYRYFKIHDPKERTISVAPFRDRVVHHSIVIVLEQLFESSFIFDSYATRKKKGTHKAILRAQSFIRQNRFYLKTDIAKYFDSIDHGILTALLQRKIKDKKVMNLLGHIIHISDLSRGCDKGKGLPIGNLTSQFFANIYLDNFDHFIKDKLGVKCYIRYMDDMVVFSNDKDMLKGLHSHMEEYLSEKLALSLKDKAMCLNTSMHGLSFLGYRVFPNIIRVRNENIRRMVRRYKKKKNLFDRGLMDEERLAASARSTFEHIAFADSYNVRRDIIGYGAGIQCRLEPGETRRQLEQQREELPFG